MSAKPILSMKVLEESKSSKDLHAHKNGSDHSNDKKSEKKKYSNFFVKNFFLKKHEQKTNDDVEDEGNGTHSAMETVTPSVDDPVQPKSDVHLRRVKVKGNTKEKEMNDLRLTQRIQHAHKGAIYCMEFSKKGDYLATGGQDSVLRIWTVCGSTADRKRWQHERSEHSQHQTTPRNSNHLNPNPPLLNDEAEGVRVTSHEVERESDGNTEDNASIATDRGEEEDARYQMSHKVDDVLSVVAFREFTGHRADIIDISWSNGEFILSASIDQTVMLWHTSRTRCLCLFQHSDIVTSVQFHPNEDYLFLSGSFDSRLRLWNILEHRVVDWVQVPTLVTCTTFSTNGRFAIAGLYDGQCFFYSTQGHRLKYVTAIECRNSSGKFRKGRKVTGLQYLPPPSFPPTTHSTAPLTNSASAITARDKRKSNSTQTQQHHSQSYPNINPSSSSSQRNSQRHQLSMMNSKNEHGSPQLLVSTNDSRLRLFNLSNFEMKCKYKGHENTQSQIHARFSPDGQLVICGSEDNNIYIWRVCKAHSDESSSIFQSKKQKNRQECYEYFKSHSKLPQVALFAPHRTVHYIHKFRTVVHREVTLQHDEEKIRHIVLTADTEGHINIYTNHSNDRHYKYPYSHHTARSYQQKQSRSTQRKGHSQHQHHSHRHSKKSNRHHK